MKQSFILLGCGIVLTVMFLTFITLFDLVILKGKYKIYTIILSEENLPVLYFELFLTFYGLVFVAIRTYKESVVFWKKRYKIK